MRRPGAASRSFSGASGAATPVAGHSSYPVLPVLSGADRKLRNWKGGPVLRERYGALNADSGGRSALRYATYLNATKEYDIKDAVKRPLFVIA